MFAPEPKYLSATNDTATWSPGAKLRCVIVGTGTATSVVTVYNGTTTADPVYATIDAATKGDLQFGDARFPNGLFVKMTTAGAKVTVVAG